MKNVLFASLVAAVAAVSLAAPKKSAYDIRPSDKDAKYPTAVVWSAENDAAIAAATGDDVLAGFVEDDEAASALLAKVRGAYASDPIALTQIAAVSQWVMQSDPFWLFFWEPSRSDGRKVWVNALVAKAEGDGDGYVKTFCLDQLRWCAPNCPCVRRRIADIGSKSGDKAVKDMADLVLKELELR
jgi:hypothetical protein